MTHVVRVPAGHRSGEGGFTIIELLVSLLIFAVAVLGLVSLQANAARATHEARFRSEAAALADELVGQMLVASPAALTTDFVPGGARFQAWLLGRVRAPRTGLPDGAANVEFGVLPDMPRSVRVTVSWLPPRAAVRDAAGGTIVESRRRSHVTVTAIHD